MLCLFPFRAFHRENARLPKGSLAHLEPPLAVPEECKPGVIRAYAARRNLEPANCVCGGVRREVWSGLGEPGYTFCHKVSKGSLTSNLAHVQRVVLQALAHQRVVARSRREDIPDLAVR